MSHSDSFALEIDKLIEAEPLKPLPAVRQLLVLMVVVGAVALLYGVVCQPAAQLWGAYFTNVVFWMGLAAGSVVISAIFQVVRATWAAPLRRIAEANVAFLPYALVFALCTYFGKEHLFPWARGPMPGREWWMQPDFVYIRFAILMSFLFFMMWRFVRMSLRSDVGFMREKARKNKRWLNWHYDGLAAGWKGALQEIPATQNRLSWNAPLLIALYAVIYSLFSFEMIMSMDTIWYSNMFGGFVFIGNIYLAWATLNMLSAFLSSRSPEYDKILTSAHRWDLGKLTFGFCMLWGYLFFSQYMPQWYGNLPEETQWMIVRVKEYPWKAWSWVCFSMCFVIPFILLVSEDVKKVRSTFACVGLIIFCGLWLERYILIMPQLSPGFVPFGIVEIGLFFGFMGIYGLTVLSFLGKYPYVQVSSPLSAGVTKW